MVSLFYSGVPTDASDRRPAATGGHWAVQPSDELPGIWVPNPIEGVQKPAYVVPPTLVKEGLAGYHPPSIPAKVAGTSIAAPRVNIPAKVSGSVQTNIKPRVTTAASGGGGGGGGQPGGPGSAYGYADAPGYVSSDGTATGGGAAATGKGTDWSGLINKVLAIVGQQAFDPKQLASLAAKMAGADVAQQTQAYTTQQQQLLNEGKQNALNILAASRAAANLDQGMAGDLRNAYLRSADELKAIAGGYAGNVRDLATADANAIKQDISNLNATPSDMIPGGLNLGTLPENLYNATYGLGGAIPAGSLAEQATQAMRGAQALPMITRGAGEQGALLAQGASQQKADALLKNIANTKATLPNLTQKYLSSLTSQATAAQRAKLMNAGLVISAIKALQSGDIAAAKAGLDQAKFAAGRADKENDYRFKVWSQTIKNDQADRRIQVQENGQEITKRGQDINKTLRQATNLRLTNKELDKKTEQMTNDMNEMAFGKYGNPVTNQGQVQRPLLQKPIPIKEAFTRIIAKYNRIVQNPKALNKVIAYLRYVYGVPNNWTDDEALRGEGTIKAGWAGNIPFELPLFQPPELATLGSNSGEG